MRNHGKRVQRQPRIIPAMIRTHPRRMKRE
jgi:hypothetical protein